MTRFDQRCHDADIFSGFFVALLDGAHAVADLETDVPKKGDELFECATTRLVSGRRDEHEDVDIGGGMQFAAAITADGHEGPVGVMRAKLAAPDLS